MRLWKKSSTAWESDAAEENGWPIMASTEKRLVSDHSRNTKEKDITQWFLRPVYSERHLGRKKPSRDTEGTSRLRLWRHLGAWPSRSVLGEPVRGGSSQAELIRYTTTWVLHVMVLQDTCVVGDQATIIHARTTNSPIGCLAGDNLALRSATILGNTTITLVVIAKQFTSRA